ncbi:putative toxin-antitoxin system toxin component, PIN family [Parvibium lacunae]|uniref:Putative toxin-antitoxin system toxin component, PIN family n=1 Tax=Parvibium lacunae TaxID=1888893 RepID=A0A368L6K0_9BURK|nr:putative toxin-antitoxin system toxin component, PIN family [Parvibium lacunae]RCS59318.1 putative toxin-antitoxin system toxin component, PIN family [Parvibium lacunae]
MIIQSEQSQTAHCTEIMPPCSTQVEKWVLDTNIILDWLHFHDRRTHGLANAVAAQQVTLYASPATLHELQRVLNYPQFKLTPEAQTALYQRYVSAVQVLDHPSAAPGTLPRCRDKEDQKFLELAQACAAQRLISKDKRLLELNRANTRRRFNLSFTISNLG